MVASGLGGALSFAFGGTIVLYVFLQTLQGHGPSGGGFVVFSFLGLILVGLGLFLIVQDGKIQAKQAPPQQMNLAE